MRVTGVDGLPGYSLIVPEMSQSKLFYLKTNL